MRRADGHEWSRSIQDQRLDVAAAHDGRHNNRPRACQRWLHVCSRLAQTVEVTSFSCFLPICSLWNYNSDNDDARGDDWNGENFSWFSHSRTPKQSLPSSQDTKELDLGGRILGAVVRPYAAKTAGVPLKFEYEMTTGAFAYSWAVPLSGSGDGASMTEQQQYIGGPNVDTPPLTGHPQFLARETEIFVPAQLAQGRKLIVEGLEEGDRYAYDEARQTLFVLPAAPQTGEPAGVGAQVHVHVHEVRVRFDPPVGGELPNDLYSDFAGPIGAALVVLLAFTVYVFLGRV